MPGLRDKVEHIRAKYNKQETFNVDQFLQLFRELEPEYQLTDDEIYGIFDFTDTNQTGKLSKADVDRVLDMILASEEDNEEGEGEGEAIQEKPKRDTIGMIRQSIRFQNDRLSSNILNDLDIDKISELKHIYSICEGNKGYANFDQIGEFIGNFKQLSSSPHHLLKIFNCVKDPNRNVVTKEAFSNLMSKLEKAILNQFVDDDESNFELNLNPKDMNQQKQIMESILVPSEVGSDSDEDLNEDDQNKNYNQDLIQEVLLIIQKVDEAVDTLKNKATPTSIKGVQTILGEVIGISYHLEKNLKASGEKLKDLKHKLQESKNIEELLNAKLGTLELNYKHKEEILLDLQKEYDQLYDNNRAFESQIRIYQHIQDEVTEKNNEIVRLERRVKDVENQKLELQNKLNTSEYDRDIALQNYKDLDSVLRKQEERMAQEEDQIRISQQFKENSSLEIESLKIELKSALAKKETIEKEKFGFEKVISELRENLINNKEFLDSLKLEKNDLQSKFNKLQRELDAMKSEVSNKRASVMPKRISVGAGGGSALDFFSGQNADYSPADFRQINEVNEDEENQEEKKSQQDDLEPKVNQEMKVADRQFDSLMSNRFSYKPGNERFSIFDPVRAAQEEVTNDFSATQNAKQSVDNTETFGPTEDARRKQTTAIDFRQLSQDYLGLKQTGLIKKILEKNKETQNDNICFSDYMYRINTRERREHRVLFITSEALYSLHPRKGYNVIRRVPLEKIYRITVSKSSAGLCAIHVYNDYDYLIDIYKRLNLILFLQNVFRYKGLKQFAIVYEQSFLVKNRNATTLKQIDQYSKAVANPELQSTYKNAQKFGELYVKSWGLFTTWTLYFFILTEVGFVCFSKAGSSKPVDFIPILGYLIIDKGTTPDGKYAFKIKFPHSDFEITLAADSDIEKKDWIRKIKAIQENAEK